MVSYLRSFVFTTLAVSAVAVAPAQVRAVAEPLQVTGAKMVMAVAPVDAGSLLTDQLAQQQPDPALDTLFQDDPLEIPSEPTVDTDEAAPRRADRPASRGDLSSLVAEHRGTDAGSREMECLAGAIYFESKGEPLSGQLAVGKVIINRAKSGRFPSSYCGVVFQRGQFSFVRGGRMPAIARGSLAWQNAVAVARIVTGDLHSSGVGRAMFFHAKRVSPGWGRTRVATIGNHIFYN